MTPPKSLLAISAFALTAVLSFGRGASAQLPQAFGKLDLDIAIASLPKTSVKPIEEVRFQ